MVVSPPNISRLSNLYLQKVSNGKIKQNAEKNPVTVLKFEHCGFTVLLMGPKDADRMANSSDPDQTAPSV